MEDKINTGNRENMKPQKTTKQRKTGDIEKKKTKKVQKRRQRKKENRKRRRH